MTPYAGPVTSDLHTQLDELETQMAQLSPAGKETSTTDALANALLAVDRQHPSAWVSLMIAADYRTERPRHTAMQRAVRFLVNDGRVEALNVHFREGERRLYRIAANHHPVDVAAVVAAANAALAPVKHKVEVYPTRAIDSSFTRHTVTHAGRSATAYLRVREYDVKISRSV